MTELRGADVPEIQTLLRPVQRWTHSRKYWLLTAIKWGHLTVDEACTRHGITFDELSRWSNLLATHGVQALMTTRIQRVREYVKPRSLPAGDYTTPIGKTL